MKKQSNLSRLLSYAGRYRNFTYASWILSAVSALIALVPFWYIWKIIKEVLEVSPNFSEAVNIVSNALSRVDGVLSAAFMPESEKKEYPKDSSVTLSDVHFSYDGKKEVIRGVSMNIGAGQTVAFVGPSSGGKTTVSRLAVRFWDNQKGKITVGGANI